MTTTLYVLNIADFRPLAAVAAENPSVRVVRRGPYLEVIASEPFAIDRAATGCRNAIWYSSVAAIRNGRVTQWDREVLRIEPTDHAG